MSGTPPHDTGAHGTQDTPAAAPADDCTMSVARANLLGVPLFLVMMAAVVVPFALRTGVTGFILGVHRFVDLKVFIPWIAAGTVVHEALHGFGWIAAGGGSFRSVKFGFHWKTITPFAHFTEPIPASAYRTGVVLPGIALGILPGAAGYALDDPSLVLFGGIFFGAAAGDALSLWAARKIPGTARVLDHPTRVGCTVAGAGEGG